VGVSTLPFHPNLILLVNSPSRRNVDSIETPAVVADDSPAVVADSPPRQDTPFPDGPLVPPDAPDHDTWNVCPSDVVSAADDLRMGLPGMPLFDNLMHLLTFIVLEVPSFFLLDPIWKGIHRKHIRVALGPMFGGGNRIGYTKFPLKFDNPFCPSEVFMFWTNNKGKWQHGFLKFKDLTPARPTKRNIFVVVLEGDLKGQVVKVDKVMKADKSVLLITSSDRQKELAENVCIVEDHLQIGCVCSCLP